MLSRILKGIDEIYNYRQMLFYLVKSKFDSKYNRSALGYLWSLISPILMIIVYTVVFSNILERKIEHFYVFISAGILPWRMFQTSVQASTSSIIGNRNLVTKVYFPKAVLPLSVVFLEVINYILTIPILLFTVIISPISLTHNVIYFPLILVSEILLASAIALLLSGLSVYYHDITHIVRIILMLLFYLSAVIYPLDSLGEDARAIVELNPVAQLVNAYRAVFYYGIQPDLFMVLGIGIVSLVLLLVFLGIFKQLERGFAEEI